MTDFLKRIFIFCLILILLYSCSSDPNKFEITGQLSGSPGGRIFLKEMTTNELVLIDSTKLDSAGLFKLSGSTEMIKFFAIHTTEENFITILAGPGDKLYLTGQANHLPITYDIEGSEDSKKIRELTQEHNKTIKKIYKLSQTFNDSVRSPNFPEIKEELDRQYNEIITAHKAFTIRFIYQNLNSMASLMALYQQIGPRRNLLDPFEDLEIFGIVDSSLTLIYPESEAVRNLHRQVTEIREQQRFEELATEHLRIGAEAPEIALPDPNGNIILLSSLRGKYVLLDFWASWCPPCRQENPNLIKNYQKYREKGFAIYQVSLDKSRAGWLKGIEDDKLDWIHVSDLKMWNSIVVTIYNIQGIPMNFLLDPEGKIIDRNLRGESLSMKLQEIFNE